MDSAQEPPSNNGKEGTIPKRERINLWLAAWVVAGLVMILPILSSFRKSSLDGIFIAILAFPVGLFGFFGIAVGPFLGWLVYFILTALGLNEKKTNKFGAYYFVLIVLLVINVGGCHYLRSQMGHGFP